MPQYSTIKKKKNLDVYIDLWDNNIFNVEEVIRRRVGCLSPWLYLRDYLQSNGIILNRSDKIPLPENHEKKYLYYSLGQLKGYQKINDRKDVIWGSFYLLEPPIKLLPKSLDIYFHLDEIQSRFIRTYTTSPISSINRCYGLNYQFDTKLFNYPQSYSSIIEEYFEKKNRKFLVMVNSYNYSRHRQNEYYSERIKALKYFFSNRSIDLYGEGWGRLHSSILRNSLKSIIWAIRWQNFAKVRDIFNSWNIRKDLKTVQNTINKYDTLSNYRYAICYESMGIEGFISEKIFDCFLVGTIPIYLGAPDINNYIPQDTYIDKKHFKSYDELDRYLQGLTESQYRIYRKNIRDFISSKAFFPFTMESFAENFLNDIMEDRKIIDRMS